MDETKIKVNMPQIKHSKNPEWWQVMTQKKQQKDTVGWTDDILEALSVQASDEVVYCRKTPSLQAPSNEPTIHFFSCAGWIPKRKMKHQMNEFTEEEVT
jgi:hypothetical protein